MSGFKRVVSQYAHSQGLTFCIYSENGEKIVTCGRDGDVRVWDGKDDMDADSVGISQDYVSCAAQHGERLLLCTEMNTVLSYTFPECKKDKIEFRFTAPATSVKMNSEFVAAGSEDFTIKVLKQDGSDPCFELETHTAPVLCLDLRDSWLASRGGDGKLVIWDLETRKAIHTIEGLDKCLSFELTETFHSIHFDSKRKHLAYCHGKKLVVVETETWTEVCSLSESSIDGQFTVCEFSPSGKLLAAGTSRGEIAIWDVQSRKLLKGEGKGKENHAITALAWNPNDTGELAFVDRSGQLEVITGASEPTSAPKKARKVSESENEDIYNEYGLVQDEAEEMDEDDDAVSLERLKNETLGIHEFDEKSKMEDEMSALRRESSPSVREIAPVQNMQPPFQCGSTPASLEHRFMVWNHVGIVRSHKTDVEDSIEVEFHDSSTHHGIHMTNHLNHTMASLSESCLALACEAPSRLVCITLKGGAGSREWSLPMPDCEEVFVVAASSKLVVVATDSRLLRIFTVFGTQREVICIPGPVVTIAAHEETIIVAYHGGASPTEDQNLNLMVLDCFGYNIRCRDMKLPMTPGSKLAWMGFSDEGSPVIFDSYGNLKLYRKTSQVWHPVWNGNEHTKGASDTFFVVRVNESLKEIHAILCRGTEYPLTVPRPTAQVFQLVTLLCDPDSEKTKLETSILMSQTLKTQEGKRDIKENTIKLFALACKSELENRARELLELISIPEVIPVAAKYAGALGRNHLAQKLADLMPQIEEKEKQIEERVKAPEVEATPELNISNNLLLNASPSIPAIVTKVIKPLPMGPGRNPFKKMNNAGTSDSNIKKNGKAFGHFQDMGLGYSPQEEPPTAESPVVEKQAPELTYVSWMSENKEALRREHPDMDDKAFNKMCMGKFRELKEQRKRKMEEDAESGVSKLARFAAV